MDSDSDWDPVGSDSSAVVMDSDPQEWDLEREDLGVGGVDYISG